MKQVVEKAKTGHNLSSIGWLLFISAVWVAVVLVGILALICKGVLSIVSPNSVN